MKKWMKISELLLLTLLAGITVSSADSPPSPGPDTYYTLDVNFGDGDGSYTNTEVVTITANVRTNEMFYRWTGDTQYVDSATSATTTVTVLTNITVTATYEAILYTLTVTNGTGGGSYTNTQVVTIMANAAPTNQAFDQWTGDTGVLASNTAITTLIMTNRAIALTATYTNLPNYYTLTVSNGTGGGTYTAGSNVTITASNAPTGQAFDRWTGHTQYVASVTSATTTVTMPSNAVSLTATYTNLPGWNALTVDNGTGGASYTNGTQVEIAADAEEGLAFYRWTGAVQYVANAASPASTVTMPAWAITLTATYKTDTNPPVIKITFPTAALKVRATNGLFTIRGTAADNKTVTNVLVKLNDDDYVSAVPTTDGWKTWTLPVELIPGTNTILAYSMDSAFNSSLISTVKCTYAETTSFTIQTTGEGRAGLSPSGAPEVGRTYTLKASPATGSAFLNWTGYIERANRVIMFTMPRDETITANFIDIQKPTVKITYPTAKKSQRVVAPGTVVLRGTAADNYGLTNVMVQLYTGEWTNAVTSDDWKNWTADFYPVSGLNTARVYSVDVNGYTSSISAVVFTYAPGAVVAVQANGDGTIKPNYNGQVLEIGKSYTMKAKAAKKLSVFTDWTYGVTGLLASAESKITFVMQSNLVLTANFNSLLPPPGDALADRAIDTPTTAQAAIVVDGFAKDWANVPCSSFSYASVTQEVAVALDGNSIALLLTGCPFDTSDNVLVYFKLRLSYGDEDNRHAVDLWTSGSVLYGMVDGQMITGLEAVLLNGVMEVKLPVNQAPSQVMIEEIGCGMDLGVGTLTELFKISPAGNM